MLKLVGIEEGLVGGDVDGGGLVEGERGGEGEDSILPSGYLSGGERR